MMISKHVVKTNDYYNWLVNSSNVLEQSINFVLKNPTAIEPDKMSVQELVIAKAYLARLQDEYYRAEYLRMYDIPDIEIPTEFAYLFYKTSVQKVKGGIYVQ